MRSNEQDHDFKLMDYVNKSLREYLIPVEQFLQDVQRIETIPSARNFIQIDVGGEGIPALARRFCLPYPYTTGAWKICCKSHFPDQEPSPELFNQLPKETLNEIATVVYKRSNDFIQHSITEETLANLDSNRSVGIICHNLSGNFISFNWDYLSRFIITAIPISVVSHIGHTYPLKYPGSGEDLAKLLRYTDRNRGQLNVWYRMQFYNPNGARKEDRIRFSDWEAMTNKSPLTPEDIKSISGYLQQAMTYKPKVIILPA